MLADHRARRRDGKGHRHPYRGDDVREGRLYHKTAAGARGADARQPTMRQVIPDARPQPRSGAAERSCRRCRRACRPRRAPCASTCVAGLFSSATALRWPSSAASSLGATGRPRSRGTPAAAASRPPRGAARRSRRGRPPPPRAGGSFRPGGGRWAGVRHGQRRAPAWPSWRAIWSAVAPSPTREVDVGAREEVAALSVCRAGTRGTAACSRRRRRGWAARPPRGAPSRPPRAPPGRRRAARRTPSSVPAGRAGSGSQGAA